LLLKSTRTRPDPRQLPQRDRTGGGRLRQGCRRSGGGGLGASGGQFLQQSRKYKISMNIIEYIYILLYIYYIYYIYIYYMRVCIFLHRYNGMYIMLLYYIIVFYVILIIILFYFLFYAILYVYIYISNTGDQQDQQPIHAVWECRFSDKLRWGQRPGHQMDDV